MDSNSLVKQDWSLGSGDDGDIKNEDINNNIVIGGNFMIKIGNKLGFD